MCFLDAVGPAKFTLSGLEQEGSRAYAELPPAAQRWAGSQAAAIVARGQFGPTQVRSLGVAAGGMFPGINQARATSVVRYLALKQTAGGNLNGLRNARGMTPLQQQLVVGIHLSV
jgi:hypothetical protein